MRYFFALLLLCAVALISCRASDESIDRPSFVPEVEPAEAVFQRASGDGVAAAKLIGAAVMSSVAVIQPPTPCEFRHHRNRHHAVVVNPLRRCVAGREFTAIFQTNYATAPRQPPRNAWLLVSTAPADPVALGTLGFDRCWLMVNTNPNHLHSIEPAPGSIVQQEHGRVVLRWTPPFSMVGQTLYAQLIWTEPGANDAQHLVSPMLKITVGTQ